MRYETLSETLVTTVFVHSDAAKRCDWTLITFFSRTNNNDKMESKQASHARVHKEGQYKAQSDKPDDQIEWFTRLESSYQKLGQSNIIFDVHMSN